jgi:AcrR family transcriptional regulator
MVDTREVSVYAGTTVFTRMPGGYRAGSLREIAQRVGMSEAGLLHHFKNKSTLLLAVLDHRDEQSRQIVNFDDADGVETLRALVKLARYNASIPVSSSSSARCRPRRRRRRTRPTSISCADTSTCERASRWRFGGSPTRGG